MKNEFLIESFLANEFDLSRREITLYLNLVKYGASTVFELAEVSNMNRSTTHVNIDSLTQKGLVNQIRKGRGSRRIIMAEPVEKLSLILKNKKAKIEAAEERLPQFAKELETLKDERVAGKEIEISRYSGKEEVRLIYDEVIKSKEIRAYVNCQEMNKIFPGNIYKFLEAHKKNKEMQIWEIMENSAEAQNYVNQFPPKRYYVRITSKELHLASIDYILYDGKIAIIDADKGVNGIVIENKNFYENSKAIYEFVWQFLSPYEK
jgi:sugar-specific transcriptional regulator TrmB